MLELQALQAGIYVPGPSFRLLFTNPFSCMRLQLGVVHDSECHNSWSYYVGRDMEGPTSGEIIRGYCCKTRSFCTMYFWSTGFNKQVHQLVFFYLKCQLRMYSFWNESVTPAMFTTSACSFSVLRVREVLMHLYFVSRLLNVCLCCS